jgi:hypothetical protein
VLQLVSEPPVLGGARNAFDTGELLETNGDEEKTDAEEDRNHFSYEKTSNTLNLKPPLVRAVSEPTEVAKVAQQSGGTFKTNNFAATAPVRHTHKRSTSMHSEGSDGDVMEARMYINGLPSDSNRKFNPDYFLSILADGPSLRPNNAVMMYTDRDLSSQCAIVTEGLQKPSDNWEDRMMALSRLQSLACMDAIDFDTFPLLLKGMHEMVIQRAFVKKLF